MNQFKPSQQLHCLLMKSVNMPTHTLSLPDLPQLFFSLHSLNLLLLKLLENGMNFSSTLACTLTLDNWNLPDMEDGLHPCWTLTLACSLALGGWNLTQVNKLHPVGTTLIQLQMKKKFVEVTRWLPSKVLTIKTHICRQVNSDRIPLTGWEVSGNWDVNCAPLTAPSPRVVGVSIRTRHWTVGSV